MELLEAIDEQHFRKQFDTNVLGLLLATQEAAAIIGDKGGSIINITRSLAQELGPRKIRVNTLAPGATDTEGVRAMQTDTTFQDYAVSRTPLGRMGTSDDIASAALFLASEDSGWITGEEILVGGGIRL